MPVWLTVLGKKPRCSMNRVRSIVANWCLINPDELRKEALREQLADGDYLQKFVYKGWGGITDCC